MVIPVIPRSYCPSDTAGIIASQEMFSYFTTKFSRLANSAIASYSQPTALPPASRNCSGG